MDLKCPKLFVRVVKMSNSVSFFLPIIVNDKMIEGSIEEKTDLAKKGRRSWKVDHGKMEGRENKKGEGKKRK